MLASLLYEARVRPGLWRRRLVYYSFRFEKETLAFALVFGLIAFAIAGIVYCAHQIQTVIDPLRLEALKQETLMAQRRADDLQCLAENVYFEARGEPLEGQYAVAEVTLNRTRSRNFPHTVCAVVHETRWDPMRRRLVADFSWTELGDAAANDGAAWKQAMTVASAAYDERREPLVPGALFYHATNVQPAWAKTKKPLATIGNHIFYR